MDFYLLILIVFCFCSQVV